MGALFCGALVVAMLVAGEFMRGDSLQPRSVERDSGIGKPLTPMPVPPPRGQGIPAHAAEATAEMEGVDQPYYLSVDKHVLTNYLDRRGGVCSWLSDMERGVMRSGGGGGCIEPRDLAQALSRSALFYSGTTDYGAFGFLEGYGRPDLTRIVSEVPGVRVDSVVTKAWAPGGNAPDGFKIKGFLVRLWYGAGVRIGSVTGPGSASGRNLDLIGVFEDGDNAPLKSGIEVIQGHGVVQPFIDPISEAKRPPGCQLLPPGERPRPGEIPRC